MNRLRRRCRRRTHFLGGFQQAAFVQNRPKEHTGRRPKADGDAHRRIGLSWRRGCDALALVTDTQRRLLIEDDVARHRHGDWDWSRLDCRWGRLRFRFWLTIPVAEFDLPV